MVRRDSPDAGLHPTDATHISGRMKPRKTLERILGGSKSIRFADLARLAEAFGFQLARVQGSHHIFSRPGVPELVNLQTVRGEAKPYQVRQFLSLVEKYNLQFNDLDQS